MKAAGRVDNKSSKLEENIFLSQFTCVKWMSAEPVVALLSHSMSVRSSCRAP